jgi:hypothetical protein
VASSEKSAIGAINYHTGRAAQGGANVPESLGEMKGDDKTPGDGVSNNDNNSRF